MIEKFIKDGVIPVESFGIGIAQCLAHEGCSDVYPIISLNAGKSTLIFQKKSDLLHFIRQCSFELANAEAKGLL